MSKSRFVYSSANNDGLGLLPILAAQAKLLFGNKGSSGKVRELIRESLEKQGFRWDHTKGYQPGDYDNIDGFDDTSLKNIIKAYEAYGPVVVQLHNEGVFNQDNTQSFQKIRQIVEQHNNKSGNQNGNGSNGSGSNGGHGTGTGLNNNQGPQNGSQNNITAVNQGSQFPGWIGPAALFAGGGVLLLLAFK